MTQLLYIGLRCPDFSDVGPIKVHITDYYAVCRSLKLRSGLSESDDGRHCAFETPQYVLATKQPPVYTQSIHCSQHGHFHRISTYMTNYKPNM